MIELKLSHDLRPETLKLARQAFENLKKRDDLGFWQLPTRNENWSLSEKSASKIKTQNLYVIGTGGSALGGRCLIETLGTKVPTTFISSTDPYTVQKVFSNSKVFKKSHFLVISKSGNTLEIAALLEILLTQLKKVKISAAKAITVITEDKPSALQEWAVENAVSVTAHPKDVGGRFSVLSPVGMVPARIAGQNIKKIRQGAQWIFQNEKLLVEISAAYLESFNRGESISVFWTYADQLASYLPWLSQLWAESLGKKQNRQKAAAPAVSTPVSCVGATDQHSVLQQFMEGAQDKMFLFLRSQESEKLGPVFKGNVLKDFEYLKGCKLGEILLAQSYATEEALRKSGRKTLSLEVKKINEETLGALLLLFQLVIGILGEALNINAFDQPGVELGKIITKEKLAEKQTAKHQEKGARL